MAEKKESEKVENIIAFSIVALIILLFIGFWNNWWGLFEGESQTDNPIVSTPILGEPVKGDPNAPITIVEYSDFECPFCGRWFSETYPLIKQQYLDTGKAMLVFKQFPLTQIHPRALDAAIAAECAFEQGNEEFWEYHDLLYLNQGNLSGDNLRALAAEVGLNDLHFDLCFSNKNTRAEVEADLKEGVQASVTGTPAFVIGESAGVVKGELIVGAHPFQKFSEVIERV